MPAKLAARIAEKSGRNLRRAILLAESCRVQHPTLQPNQDIQARVQDCRRICVSPLCSDPYYLCFFWGGGGVFSTENRLGRQGLTSIRELDSSEH